MGKSNEKVFGVIGGQGSIATAKIYTRIVELATAQGARTDDDFPQVIITNLASDALDHKGVVSSQSLRQFLRKNLRGLNALGVEQVFIACNTAHIGLVCGRQVTSLPQIVANQVNILSDSTKILLLCSHDTQNQKVYEGFFPDPIELHYAHNQDLLNDFIASVMGNQIDLPTFIDFVKCEVDRAELKDLAVIVLGCTELTFFAEALALAFPKIKVLDSGIILAETIVAEGMR